VYRQTAIFLSKRHPSAAGAPPGRLLHPSLSLARGVLFRVTRRGRHRCMHDALPSTSEKHTKGELRDTGLAAEFESSAAMQLAAFSPRDRPSARAAALRSCRDTGCRQRSCHPVASLLVTGLRFSLRGLMKAAPRYLGQSGRDRRKAVVAEARIAVSTPTPTSLAPAIR